MLTSPTAVRLLGMALAAFISTTATAFAQCTVTTGGSVTCANGTATVPTTNTNGASAASFSQTQLWNNGTPITATINSAVTVLGYGLALQETGGTPATISFTSNANSNIITVIAANPALQLLGNGGNISYTGNGTVSSFSGPGLVASNTGSGSINITTGGTISGGGGANAITFTGGADTLTLQTGWHLIGNIGNGGSSLTFGQAIAVTLPNVISGSGSIIQSGAGILTLTGANTYTGATVVNGSLLAIGAGGSIASSSGVSLGGTNSVFDISGSGGTTIQGLTGAVGSIVSLGSQTLTVAPASGTNVYSGVLEDGGVAGGGGGSLVKSGGGTLLLTQSNPYTGSTTISGGSLALTGAGSIASSSSVTLSGGANLDISDTTSGTTVQNLSDTVGVGSVSLGSKTLTVNVPAGPASVLTAVIQDGGIGGGSGGSLVKSGAGTLLLTQANTYTGGTTISGGTLALTGTGSIATSNSLALNTAGTSFDISFTTAGATVQSLSGVAGTSVSLGGQPLTANVANGSPTFSGTISDGGIGGGVGGSLIKSGAGVLILDGSETYTGGTSVNAGTLEVGDVNTPGATLAGNVAVNSGGTLMGHGTIGGNVVNGGNVQPGGTVGLLTVSGNYTQSSAGTLTIEITPNVAAGPGVGYDQLLVGGTATLAGGLSVTTDLGNYVLGSRYAVLTAAGGRTGTFASVAFSSPFAGFITPAVSYDPNDVFLMLVPTPAPPAAPGAPPAPVPLFNGGQQVPDMLTAMVSAVQGVGDTVLGDVCGPTAQRLVTQGEGCVVHPLDAGYRVEVWMRGLGGVGSLTGSGPRLSFNNSYAGTLIGAGIGQGGFTVGIGGGYLMTAVNFSDGSNASQNAGLGFVYGRYAQGPMWFGAMAAYGGGNISGARSFAGTGLTASGNRDGDFGIVKAQAAYDIPLGTLTFEPRASLSYIHAGQNGFSESGASILDLTYANTNADVFEGRLVGRVMQRFVAGTWSLVPYVEAGVQETFTGLSRGVTMTDGAFAGSAAGISPAPTAGVVGIGLSAGMTEALDLFVAYQGQFSANQAENTFAAGLVYRF